MSGQANYRPCVGVMLARRDGLVFVGRRIGTGNAWQMPQGGIDAGEAPHRAALREMAEEIGTNRAVIVAESAHWHRYDLPPRLANRLWRGRYRGQTQKWFLLRFTGEDIDIHVDTAHPEFDAWRWVAVDALLDLVVPFKRDVYGEVVAEFQAIIRAANWPTRDAIHTNQGQPSP
ncbi:MAG: RNA pyrophosphohydrolase [Alphaproteobacteria bacterium]|nr:RNA pyrophosphohydrolase [Alphaproteobacteria bacterium]